MTNIKSLVLALAVLGSTTGIVLAHEGHDYAEDEAASASNEEGTTTTAVEVGNKLCPVTGNPVDDKSMGEPVSYEYNGKIYTLCCSMCEKDFKNNPEKYSAIAEKEVSDNKQCIFPQR